MFKVVQDQENAPCPSFLMWCDASCSTFISSGVHPDAIENPEAHNGFAAEAVRQGWMVRLDKQLCPVHAKRYAEAVKMTRPRIQLVGNLALKN